MRLLWAGEKTDQGPCAAKDSFSKPCPPDMLTVPACNECNQSFKGNDEYTRAVLAFDVRAASHRDVIGSLTTLMRSFQRPEARRFAQYFSSQMEPIPVLGVNGMPIHKLTQDVRRIDATGERIVRGLYYIEKKKPLDANARIVIVSEDDMESSNPLLLDAVQAYDASTDQRKGGVGNAFSYVAGFEGDRSVWVLMLYGFFFWFALIGDYPIETESGDRPREAV
jgi:hypothetical protein